MTSSLVGSEMCIRDSPLHGLRLDWGRIDSLRCIPGSAGHDALGIFPPVSYTHLTLPTICSV
eukprot:8339280-Prorocentrum_lima.AAC.1